MASSIPIPIPTPATTNMDVRAKAGHTPDTITYIFYLVHFGKLTSKLPQVDAELQGPVANPAMKKSFNINE